MERVQKMGRILACADAWFWPFSRTARKNEPPGLEIEILQSIAKNMLGRQHAWVNTGMRFGVGFLRVLPSTGASATFSSADRYGDDHHMPKHKMAFTKAFMSTGYVLVTQGPAAGVKPSTMPRRGFQSRRAGLFADERIAQANGIPHETFSRTIRYRRADQGQVNAR